MPLIMSSGARSSYLGGGLQSLFDNGALEIRSGVQPTTSNDPPTGTVLSTIVMPVGAFAAPLNGVMSLNAALQDASADDTGVATWFRLKAAGDGGGASTTDPRIDGSITAVGGGGSIELNQTSITAGQVVDLLSLDLLQPAK